MTTKRLLITVTGVALLALAGCSAEPVGYNTLAKAEYWQRANVTEATYMEGPKAQQMLNRDISRCVVELRELEKLGAIRKTLPADRRNAVPAPATPEDHIAQWETPERDGYLLAEHLDYNDFETCMQAKGWERAQYLPYDTAVKARKDYLYAITETHNRVKTTEEPSKPKSDFSNLNE